MKTTHRLACLVLVCSWFIVSIRAFAQKDPGFEADFRTPEVDCSNRAFLFPTRRLSAATLPMEPR